MTGLHGPADKTSKDQGETETSSSKVSKKRKLVQTKLFAFMGQGRSTKKVKLDHPEEIPTDDTPEQHRKDVPIPGCMDPNQGDPLNNDTENELDSDKKVPDNISTVSS